MTAYFAPLSPQHRPWRWSLWFDYSPAMIAAIKTCIPSRQRKYVPDLRAWYFKDEARELVLALALTYCGPVVHLDAPATDAPEVAAYHTLHLLPSAPDELVKAAYRVMTKLNHPDAGGTTEAMQSINAAYGTLAHRHSVGDN